MKVKPKKSLGQHFLTDLSIAERIAGTLDAYTGIPVVEVGPGMGVLTQFLIEKRQLPGSRRENHSRRLPAT